MNIEVSIAEVKEIIKDIQKQPEKIFEMMRADIKEKVGNYLSKLMEVEFTHFLGRLPYERKPGDTNHRNGFYDRNFTLKGIGEVAVNVPRDRNNEFKSQVIPSSKRYEDSLRHDLCFMFLTGISTRSLSMLSLKLIGRKISPAEVSNVNKELSKAVEAWRTRDLSELSIKYIFADGVNFHMRVGRSVEIVPVLVAIGITESGQKIVLSLQSGDKESASC